MFPSVNENPDGLHGRYAIAKANGQPVDPRAMYFVLRLDGLGSDPAHIAACRRAIREYVLHIREFNVQHLWKLADDLETLVDNLDREGA